MCPTRSPRSSRARSSPTPQALSDDDRTGAALDRLDEHGVPQPDQAVVSLPWRPRSSLAAVGARRRRVVVLRARAVAAGRTTGLGRHCRLREPHGRADVQPHARADVAPRARGRGFITAYDRNGLRRTSSASPLPEKLDETRRARTGRQAGPWRRAVRLDRQAGQRLHASR